GVEYLSRHPMTRLSRYFLPTVKEPPADAEAISHVLMVRAGLVRQLGTGMWTWLAAGRGGPPPLGGKNPRGAGRGGGRRGRLSATWGPPCGRGCRGAGASTAASSRSSARSSTRSAAASC